MPVTEDEVRETLINLNDCSPGYDNIDSKLLVSVQPHIVKPLTYIFNLSLEKGTVPSELKVAKIIPIYKDDDPAVFNHYRPISILPVISKVLEKLVYQKLVKHLDENNIIYTHQYGFRKKHSTHMALTHLINEIYTAKDKKGNYCWHIFGLIKGI